MEWENRRFEKGIERAQEEKKRRKWKENKEWRGKKDSL